MPRIIGLTGGIATGKSTVSSEWKKSPRVQIIDADDIARNAVKRGRPALWLIRRRFGRDVLQADGTLDRAALGRIVFQDAGARRALNRRTHPFIVGEMLAWLFVAVFVQWRRVVVLDAPLLLESGTLVPFCSRVVVVACSETQQVKRMVLRDGEAKGISEQDARDRIASQMALEEKIERADVVIDNSGDVVQLKERAAEVLEELQPSPVGEFVFRALVCSVVCKVLVALTSCRKCSG